jgi:glycosyltransferase involved in cell wall biosynthesis
MNKISFFIPCLNEEKNILLTLKTLLKVIDIYKLDSEIIIVDDASTDNTSIYVDDFIKNNQKYNIILIKNKINKGLGTNYIDIAFKASGKYYMLINGDNAETEESIINIIKNIGLADIIIPYFGNKDQRNKSRKLISIIFTKILNFISGYNIPYYNGPVLHLTYNVMRWSPDTHGYAYQAELITRIVSEGGTFKNVQINNQNRSFGTSKAFNIENILSIIHSLLQIFLRRLRYLLFYRKLK